MWGTSNILGDTLDKALLGLNSMYIEVVVMVVMVNHEEMVDLLESIRMRM